MMFRLLLGFVLSLVFGAGAWACSCAITESGNVSELLKNHVSVWVVPTTAKLEVTEVRVWRREYVSYRVELLEGFGQDVEKIVTVVSDVDDRASCGTQLTLGVPQFLTLYRNQDGDFSSSTCAPELPYSAVKAYLKTGEDNYIPSLGACLNEENDVIMNKEECQIWEARATSWRRHGDEDWLDYILLWRDRSQNKALVSNKPWWKFWD